VSEFKFSFSFSPKGKGLKGAKNFLAHKSRQQQRQLSG